MSAISFPARLDPVKWAEHGFAWAGQVPLARFERLWAMAAAPAADEQVRVDCRFRLDDRHVIRLAAVVQAEVPLTCQRCLQPVRWPVDLSLDLAIVQDEAHMARVDDDTDVVVMREAQLAHGHPDDQQLGLLELLEDEVLLVLPMSPRHEAGHENCRLRQATVGPVVESEQKPNPFGVLAQLKQNKPG